MKTEIWHKYDKKESLLNKCLELADELLEMNKSKDHSQNISQEKMFLNTIFQEKLKKNLKKQEPLNKSYPNRSEDKNLEEELIKTLKIYTDSGLEPRYEGRLVEELKRNFKVYGDSIPKEQATKISRSRESLAENIKKELRASSHLSGTSILNKETLEISKTENIKSKLKTKPKEYKNLSSEIGRLKKDIDKNQKAIPETFFSEDVMQKIRLLHYKIETFEKKMENFKISDLNLCHEYINLLNVNYKTQSQIKILNELDISPVFHDPIENREIKIWDLMLECGRVLCILAKAYSKLSRKFESKNNLTNAIMCMVECSKAFKTAAYFSAAHTRQEDIGTFLSAENLELNSEEARIIAQNLAIKKENENLFQTSQLYSGLAALLNRLQYLKGHEKIKQIQLKALISYYKGKACHLKAKAILNSSDDNERYNDRNVINYQKKANYYFYKSEEIWENLIKTEVQISDGQKKQITQYLAAVNEEIMENDVELIDFNEANKIPDPEPFIAIPENTSYCIPKFTKYLMNFPSTMLEKKSIKNVSLEQASKSNELNTLINQKSGIGRTMKQLKFLYQNGDIDINTFTELFEKYSTKEKDIEARIEELKTLERK
ncbi:MAG: hypothetical protein ACFFA8_02875 [Promethearchaeota archaeon]